MMASRMRLTRCCHRAPSTSRSASPAGMASIMPTRSQLSMSCFDGVTCIHR